MSQCNRVHQANLKNFDLSEAESNDAKNMFILGFNNLVKYLMMADSWDYKLKDEGILAHLASLIIEQLCPTAVGITLGSDVNHSDIMCLLMTLKHRPQIEPKQLNSLLGKDLVRITPSIYEQSLTFYRPRREQESGGELLLIDKPSNR